MFRPTKSARQRLLLATTALALARLASPALAFDIDTGNQDWAVRWDNTVKYSSAYRLSNPDAGIASLNPLANSNASQGDLNFKRGFISNRIDVLSEFDAVYQDRMGLRVSGAGWYDSVYNGHTANSNPAASSNYTAAINAFPNATRTLEGRDVELLDAMVFRKFDLPDDQTLTVRAGRFSQLYGETLFFGANGIAAAQGPVDVIKALSVPNSQFKEIMMPVGQISATWLAPHDITLGGYYQFEYRPDRLPGVGSYFSDASIYGEGVQTMWIPGSLPGALPNAGLYMSHIKDMQARSQGQGGMQLRWKASENWEFGFYAANYHEKDPAAVYYYVNPTGFTAFPNGNSGVNIGTFRDVYNQNVQTAGLSFATAVGDTNVSGEFSLRHNQSLATADGSVLSATLANNNTNNTAYLRGDTAHLNISAITLFTENGIWDGASLVGEIGANQLLGIINKSEGALDPRATRRAVAMRLLFEPSFFQVRPNLDISIPIGFGYGLDGRSVMGSHIGNFNPGGVSDISLGIKADINKVWKASLSATFYLGPVGQPTSTAARYLSYAQDYADRNFVAFSVSRSF